MEYISLDDIKKIEVEILDYFVSICEKNNLRYFLAYGTLIGAIRHKGFIPWDDDIDVWMPRPDYDRFLEIYDSEKKDNYNLVHFTNSKGFYRTFAKITDMNTSVHEENDISLDYGIWIDIFPIDGLGNTKEEAETNFKNHVDKCGRIIAGARPLKNLSFVKLCGRILWKCLFGIGGINNSFIKERNKLLKYDFDNTKYVGSICGFGPWEIIEQEKLSDFIMVDFEGKKYRAPIGYDEYLRKAYGDYMVPPPEEKRVSNHQLNATYR